MNGDTRKFVRSFDVFDTLIVRSLIRPDDLFNVIEQKHQIQNFRSIRMEAQRVFHSLDNRGGLRQIYNRYQEISKCNDIDRDRLYQLEILEEIEHSSLIAPVVEQVRDGDILVSDMYMDASEISQILKSIGFSKSVTIISSTDGKSSGRVWDGLLKQYDITLHIGDNYTSDVVSPSRFGIKSELVEITKFTNAESLFISHGLPNVALLLRRIRCDNPYTLNSLEYQLYDISTKYSIPLCVMCGYELNRIMDAEKRTILLALTRDGCLIERFFKRVFTEKSTIRFESSRTVNIQPNADYVKYIKSIDWDNAIMYDGHGSYNTGRAMFLKVLGFIPRMHVFDYSKNPIVSPISQLTWFTSFAHPLIEFLHSDTVGPLVDFSNGLPIRVPQLRRDFTMGKINTVALEKFTRNHHVIRDQPSFKDSITKLYRDAIMTIDQSIYKPIQETVSLTELANKYQSDKGTSFMCAHGYTKHYEKIVSILESRQMDRTILEIGLNRENENSIPSINMWMEYFNHDVEITGVDIKPGFKKFESTSIKILIGDQSSEEFLATISGSYSMIIDDGYHASIHQQISFKNLWRRVKSGGCYIIEDLHYQPTNETDHDRTVYVISALISNSIHETPILTKNFLSAVLAESSKIELLPSFSTKWIGRDLSKSFAIIWKK